MRQRGWTRRAALTALTALGGAGVTGVAAGCSWRQDEPEPQPPDPLEPLLQGTRELIASYAEVLVAHPELAELRPLHEAHLAHEQVLLGLIGRPELATPSGGAAGRWVPPASPTPVAGSAEEAVAGLRAAETGGQDAAWQACLAAPPERAAVLGSITAARATHVVVLA